MNGRETGLRQGRTALWCMMLTVLLAPLNGYAQGGNEWKQLTEQQVQQFANNPEIKTAPQQWMPVPESSVQYIRSKAVNAEYPKPEVIKFDPADKRYSFDDVTVYNSNKTELVSFSHKVRVFSYIVPNTVAALNSYAFSSDVRINMLFFANGLRHIGYRAFYGARHIDNIVLPPTVQTIGNEAFADMGGLTHNIFIMAAEPPVVTGNRAFAPNVQVIVPKGSAAKYRQAPGWNTVRSIKETRYLLPNGQPVVTTGTSFQPSAAPVDDKCVDLGLSVKWASRNLDAVESEQTGNFYAWGELRPKKVFRYENYQRQTPSKDMANIGLNIGGTKFDPARVGWGDGWRLPTKEECEELIEKCQWQWTSKNGVEGMLVTGPSGNSIFLPAGGERDAESLSSEGTIGAFWTANVEHGNGNVNQSNAFFLNINKYFTTGAVKSYWRYQGKMIRPVKK